MTPTKAVAILRQLTDWRKGVDVDPPKPGEVFEAIDAAIALIERLEAAEKERDALWATNADLTINIEYLGTLKTSYDEFIGKLQDERNDLQTDLKEVRYRTAVAHDTIKALRAKIEAMEQQKPIAEWIENRFDCYPQLVWAADYKVVIGTKLYDLPGAKGE